MTNKTTLFDSDEYQMNGLGVKVGHFRDLYKTKLCWRVPMGPLHRGLQQNTITHYYQSNFLFHLATTTLYENLSDTG